MATKRNSSVGLDLGQAADFTALVVTERTASDKGDSPSIYSIRHLQRFPLGTSYLTIADDVAALVRSRLSGCLLAIDATGVGSRWLS